MDRIITDQDREQAAELKVKANKAFACKSQSDVDVDADEDQRGMDEKTIKVDGVHAPTYGLSNITSHSPR